MTDYGPLTLHVPEPAVRPGGTPDFSSVGVPRAGSVERPDVKADPESIRDLAYSIIRVLNREGKAIGPWGGLLSDEDRSTIRGIPILMDVPGIGLLFQSRRHQTVKTQLIFFMRIHIMGEGIPRTTRVYRPGSTMEEIENKTGVVLPDAPKTIENKKTGAKP